MWLCMCDVCIVCVYVCVCQSMTKSVLVINHIGMEGTERAPFITCWKEKYIICTKFHRLRRSPLTMAKSCRCVSIIFTFVWINLLELKCVVWKRCWTVSLITKPLQNMCSCMCMWWLLPGVQGFGENVWQFIPCLCCLFVCVFLRGDQLAHTNSTL